MQSKLPEKPILTEEEKARQADIQLVHELMEQKAQEELEKAKHSKEGVKETPLSQRMQPKANYVQTLAMRNQPLEARDLSPDISRTQELKSLQMSNYANNFDYYNNMPSIGSRIRTVLFGIFAGIVIFLAVIIGGGLIFGFKPYVVTSGSMEPELPVGCLLIVRAVDPLTLRTGDDITYQFAGGEAVTHRIVTLTIDPEDLENSFVETRGINNEGDGTEIIPLRNIVGKVYLSVPVLGGVFLFVKNYLYIIIPALITLIIAFVLITKLIKKNQEKQAAQDLIAKQMEEDAAIKKAQQEREQKQADDKLSKDLKIDFK